MRAHRLNVTVPEDHQLQVDLPGDFPAGPAEVIVLAEVPKGRNVVRLGGVLGPAHRDGFPDRDPIAEALGELRAERGALLDTRAARFEGNDPAES